MQKNHVVVLHRNLSSQVRSNPLGMLVAHTDFERIIVRKNCGHVSCQLMRGGNSLWFVSHTDPLQSFLKQDKLLSLQTVKKAGFPPDID